MAITTIAGAMSGAKRQIDFCKSAPSSNFVAGRPHSYWYAAGTPAGASVPSPGIGGTTLTSTTGQLEFNNPASGNTYLNYFGGSAIQAGTLWLCDRLWHNSGITITSTSEQTFTSSTDIPSRDMNGAALGDGVYGAVEVSGVTGSGSPTLTLGYINSTNEGGTRYGTNIVATASTTQAGTFFPCGMVFGDKGIRRAVSLTLSATWTSGTIHVVLYRVLAKIAIGSGHPQSQQQELCCLTNGFARAYDNTVPFLVFVPLTTTASPISGRIQWTQG